MTWVRFPPGMQVQGMILPAGLFAWLEIDEVGRRVNWCVTARGEEEPVNWGTDPIPGATTPEAKEAAMEARAQLLLAMYDLGAGHAAAG